MIDEIMVRTALEEVVIENELLKLFAEKKLTVPEEDFFNDGQYAIRQAQFAKEEYLKMREFLQPLSQLKEVKEFENSMDQRLEEIDELMVSINEVTEKLAKKTDIHLESSGNRSSIYQTHEHPHMWPKGFKQLAK